jgi:hypothetical protein
LVFVLVFFVAPAAVPVVEDPVLPMGAMLGQERLQDESGEVQQWQGSVERKTMTAAEWGKQLFFFPLYPSTVKSPSHLRRLF